jgi:hypothetical protein
MFAQAFVENASTTMSGKKEYKIITRQHIIIKSSNPTYKNSLIVTIRKMWKGIESLLKL